MAFYQLQAVETAAHRRAFLECPDQHYRTPDAAPYYVRPNDQEVEAIFDPRKNKLFAAGGQATRWLLLDAANWQAVGRVSNSNSVITGPTFTVVPAPPTITSFSPTSAAVGASVILTGSGFSTTLASNTVYFGAVKATVTAATAPA